MVVSPIIVIGPDGRVREGLNAERFAGEAIFVYCNGIDHYDAFVLAEGWDKRSREILETILARASLSPWITYFQQAYQHKQGISLSKPYWYPV